MNARFNSIAPRILALSIAALAAGQAMASAGIANGEIYPTEVATSASTVTRAEVKATLAQAVRTGDIAAAGEFSGSVNQLYPVSPQAASVISRQAVKDQLAVSARAGAAFASGEFSLEPNGFSRGNTATVAQQGAAGQPS